MSKPMSRSTRPLCACVSIDLNGSYGSPLALYTRRLSTACKRSHGIHAFGIARVVAGCNEKEVRETRISQRTEHWIEMGGC